MPVRVIAARQKMIVRETRSEALLPLFFGSVFAFLPPVIAWVVAHDKNFMAEAGSSALAMMLPAFLLLVFSFIGIVLLQGAIRGLVYPSLILLDKAAGQVLVRRWPGTKKHDCLFYMKEVSGFEVVDATDAMSKATAAWEDFRNTGECRTGGVSAKLVELLDWAKTKERQFTQEASVKQQKEVPVDGPKQVQGDPACEGRYQIKLLLANSRDILVHALEWSDRADTEHLVQRLSAFLNAV